MIRTNRARGSLRARFLGVVLAGAVIPLASIGFWLSTNAIRSGESLLQSQLNETLSRQAADITERWTHRTSDAMLLADNEPLRVALASNASDPPDFLVAAFATMPALQSATFRDSTGGVRFVLGESLAEGIGRNASNGAVAPSPTIGLNVPVRDRAGSEKGEVAIRVRASELFPAELNAGPDAPMFGVKDRSTGAWLVTPAAPATLLADSRFTWDGQDWLLVRRNIDEPPIEIMMASRLEPIIAPFARNARVGSIALVIAALVVMLVTVLATLRLTRSLGDLAVAADAVADGDLNRRVEAHGNDEVGRVASAFNAMTESLRRMMRERSQTEALAAMGELAAVLAHQVRSPLTAMRLDLQRVEARAAEGDRELVTRAIQQVDRLERAVGGALKMAKTAAASFDSVDLRVPLDRAIHGLEQLARARGATVDVANSQAGSLIIRGDVSTLEQLFANVLHNAVEATGRDGRVSVRTSRVNGTVTVEIEDTGTGMNAETLSRVFEPYFSEKPDGIGIGLAVAQRIARAHGGTIDITSQPGQGTRVSISFSAIASNGASR